MKSLSSIDWVRIAPDVALKLLGEPKTKKPTEWRYGNKGSLVVNIEAATWWDFENDVGGGLVDLIKYKNSDINDILSSCGYDLAPQTYSLRIPPPTSSGAKSLSPEQMKQLNSEAIISLAYSDSFVVMRFPENHRIKQKYAPFSKKLDGSWSMKRPEGLMPIYYKAKNNDLPIVICEGEKATVACRDLYDGDACTWHGGVNAWIKSDWSPIYGKQIYIWPDNDKAGFDCADKLYKHLKKNGCVVKIVNPPESFADKDDLWDANVRNDFANSNDLLTYMQNNLRYVSNNEFELLSYSEMEANDRPPEWLIDKIAEKETVVSIYAEPKAGKSFIGISMMLAIATGKNWYGYDTSKSGVLYFCGEGEKSIFKRILAWEKHFDANLKSANFRVSNRPARILDDDDYDDILEKSQQSKKEFGKLGLIIIDTLQRNFGGGDENSTSDMNNFISKIDRLKFETGACIVLIHHTGHAGAKSNGIRRGRGSSVLPASVDAEFFIERKDKKADGDFLGVEDKVMYVKMTQTLNKEDMNMPTLNFKMQTVADLGKDKDKKSAVLIAVDEEDMPHEALSSEITDKQQIVLNALLELAKIDDPDEPECKLYLADDLVGRVKDGNKDMTKGSIQDRLKELKNKELVKHVPYKGYQHKEYAKLAPKFN